MTFDPCCQVPLVTSLLRMTSGVKLQLLVDGVMRSPVATIEPTATLREASRSLRDRQIGTLAVVDNSDVLGIISERDVVRALADGADADRVPVVSVMSRDPRYLTAGERVEAAVDVMLTVGIRHLPVFEEGELIGMVSVRDLVAPLRS